MQAFNCAHIYSTKKQKSSDISPQKKFRLYHQNWMGYENIAFQM